MTCLPGSVGHMNVAIGQNSALVRPESVFSSRRYIEPHAFPPRKRYEPTDVAYSCPTCPDVIPHCIPLPEHSRSLPCMLYQVANPSPWWPRYSIIEGSIFLRAQ